MKLKENQENQSKPAAPKSKKASKKQSVSVNRDDKSTQEKSPGGTDDSSTAEPDWIWWEKTVEYLYALTQLGAYSMICPLDGSHERAGDVICKKEAQWCLIEFKRYGPSAKEKNAQGVIEVEQKKFKGSEQATRDLQKLLADKKPDFHHIVHGIPATGGMALAAHDYWVSNESRKVEELLTKFTCDEQSFYEYLTVFMKAKGGGANPGTDSGGGNGGASPGPDTPRGPHSPTDKKSDEQKKEIELDFTNVLAIVNQKEILCCPVREFYSLLKAGKQKPSDPMDGDDGQGDKPVGPTTKGGGGLAMEIAEIATEAIEQQAEIAWQEMGMLVNEPEIG